MDVFTSRFGVVRVHPDDVLRFASGLIGLSECRRFVLLPDSKNESVAWLQSVTRPEIALPVVSPRRFVRDYQLRVSRNDLAPLEIGSVDDAEILAVVVRHGDALTMNLKAPLVVNLRSRLGRQVVASGNQSTQHVFVSPPVATRKAA